MEGGGRGLFRYNDDGDKQEVKSVRSSLFFLSFFLFVRSSLIVYVCVTGERELWILCDSLDREVEAERESVFFFFFEPADGQIENHFFFVFFSPREQRRRPKRLSVEFPCSSFFSLFPSVSRSRLSDGVRRGHGRRPGRGRAGLRQRGK